MACRVLLVEDDPRLATSVVQYLELQGMSCDHSLSAEHARQLLLQSAYDVLVSDVNLPRQSGFSLCEQLRRQGLDLPFLLLTSRSSLDDKEEGFAAGADDYLVKPFALRELSLRVQALSKRKSTQTSVIELVDLQLRVDVAERRVYREDRAIDLSNSCWQLLLALVRAYPHPVAHRDLEFLLWGDTPPDSDGLKVHMHHLRQRLDKPFARPLIHNRRGFGFVLSVAS